MVHEHRSTPPGTALKVTATVGGLFIVAAAIVATVRSFGSSFVARRVQSVNSSNRGIFLCLLLAQLLVWFELYPFVYNRYSQPATKNSHQRVARGFKRIREGKQTQPHHWSVSSNSSIGKTGFSRPSVLLRLLGISSEGYKGKGFVVD